MRRGLRQASFTDGLVNQRAGRNGWLDEIDQVIDWSAVMTYSTPATRGDHLIRY